MPRRKLPIKNIPTISDMPTIRVVRSPQCLALRIEKLSVEQRHSILRTGFGNLLLIPKHGLSKTLLTELIEKWSCERQAFHLVDSDIAMTPMDIALVMGLRVFGKPVILPEDQPVSDLEIEYEANLSTRKIGFGYLQHRLDSLGQKADDDFIRTFLLFSFASVLFPSSNGDIDSRYLNILRDLDEVHEYAWGVAVLNNLTSWMSKRKREGVAHVGGCLAFLQIWFYEHVDLARPSLHMDSQAFPRISRWGDGVSHDRLWVKAAFENLKDEQIIQELQPTEFEAVRIRELLPAPSPQDDIIRERQPTDLEEHLPAPSAQDDIIRERQPTDLEELLPAPSAQDDEDLWPKTRDLMKENADLRKDAADLREENALLRAKDRLRSLSTKNLVDQLLAATSKTGRRR